MKENIVIVGAGTESQLIGKSIAHLMPNDVVIVEAENLKKEQLPFPKSEPFIIKPHPMAESYFGGKKFVCKGKHQYSKVTDSESKLNGNWVCECGRILGT